MNKTVDLKLWNPGMGKTGVELYMEFEPDKGSRGRLAAILHGLPVFVQARINLDGSRLHADLSDLYDVVHDPSIAHLNSIKCLNHALQRLYPEVFGVEDEHDTTTDFNYMNDFRILETFVEGDTVEPGFHHYASTEALILEPEDWTWEQWKTLCTLCGMKPEDTARMVLNLDSVEVYNEPGVVITDFKSEEDQD